jgi:ParB/RepB/Spo0J family partition protein
MKTATKKVKAGRKMNKEIETAAAASAAEGGAVTTTTAVETGNGAGAVVEVAKKRLVVIDRGEIDPTEVVVNEEANGRRYPTNIEGMAKSLLENGQEQAVVVRREEEDGQLHLVFGFRRARAAQHIVEHGLDPQFQLRYEVVEMTAEEAFLHNIIENKEREETSVIDDAHNYLRLKNAPYGWSQKAIASHYGISDALVSRALTLVCGTKDGQFPPLSAKLQKLVHTGKIPNESAYNLVLMDEAKREAFVARVLAGKASTVDSKQDAAPRKKVGKGGEVDAKAGKVLSAKAIRLPFEEAVNTHEGKPTPFVKVCDIFARVCVGKLKAATALKQLRELVGD